MPGTLFIVAAPSGAGKTTLVSGLLERDPLVKLKSGRQGAVLLSGHRAGRYTSFVGDEGSVILAQSPCITLIQENSR